MTNKQALGTVLVGAAVIIFIIFVSVVVGGTGFTLGGSDGARKVSCDVKLKQVPIKGVAVLDDISCEDTGRKCVLGFGFFQSDGNVELWDSDGRKSTKDFETGFLFGTDSITLTACTADDSIRVRLYDEDHNFLEEQTKQV